MADGGARQGDSGSGQIWSAPQAGGPQQGHVPPAPVGMAPARQRGPFGTGFGLGAGAVLGGGLVAAVFATLATFALIAMAALGTLAQPKSSAGPVSLAWGDASAEDRLLAIPVAGPILGHESEGAGGLVGGTFGYSVAHTLDELDADEYDGVVLEMNTPGGTIYGSRAIAEAVERYQKRTGNKVLAFVQGISASGGMFAMSPADEIVADYGTLTGSIGVIMGPFQRYRGVVAYGGTLFTPGVETRGGITSEYLTAGKGKDFGNPFRAMTKQERSVLAAGLQREYAGFVQQVSEGRDIPAQRIRQQIGAYVYDAQRAKALKLIDRVGGQSAAFERAAEINKLDPDDVGIYRQQQPGLLDSLLGSDSAAEEPSARSKASPAAGLAVCSGRRMALAYYGDLDSLCGRRG